VTKQKGFKDSKGGGGEADLIQDGTVDLQYGIGVDGDLHSCIQGHHPKKGFFLPLRLKNQYIVKLLYLVHNTVYFLLCRLK
jgi:hypothetical protein